MKNLKVSFNALAFTLVMFMVSCNDPEIAPNPVPEPEIEDLASPVVPAKMEARISIAAAEYQTVFEEMKGKGLHPIYIDGFLHTAGVATDAKTGTYFNVIFKEKKGTEKQKFYHGLTEDGLKAKIIELLQDSYKLTFVESYPQNGNIRYAAIFKTQQTDDFHPEINVPIATWQAKFDDLVDEGYRLATRSIVWNDGEKFVTALFDTKNVGGWVSKSLLTPEQMQDFMDQQNDAGKSVSHFDVIQESPTKYLFGAIFNTEPIANWYALNGLSKTELMSKMNEATNNGYSLQTLDAYDKYEPINGNEYYVTYYVASWRK